MTQTKMCNGCKTTKPIELFGRYTQGPDGFHYKCKECRKLKVKTPRIAGAVVMGKRFGRLVVKSIDELRRTQSGHIRVWCDCDCGNRKSIIASTLTRKTEPTTRSCGCLRRELAHERKSKPLGEGSFNGLLCTYKISASKRGLVFDIDTDNFRSLTQSPCYYCGAPPSNEFGKAHPTKKLHNGSYIYNGLDRRDNLLGYTLDNCVPCCKLCNFAKGHMTHDDFLKTCVAVAKRISSGAISFLEQTGKDT